MTTAQWLTVDERWGRRAIDFATLLEPAACREYVAMHHHLDVRAGDLLLDIACGSGLAMELAAVRGEWSPASGCCVRVSASAYRSRPGISPGACARSVRAGA